MPSNTTPVPCGKCGLEAENLASVTQFDANMAAVGKAKTFGCPACNCSEVVGRIVEIWNAAQFAARTERINAAAVVITSAGFGDSDYFADVVGAAERLIDAQDAAARERWAAMNKEGGGECR